MDYATIVSELYLFSELFSLPVMFMYCIIGIVMAFFGYKIFKAFLRATYAIAGGVLAAEMVTLFIPVENWLPNVFGLSWTAVIAIVVGVLAGILAPFIYKFVGGAIFGASLGAELMYTFGVTNEIAVAVVAGILAILFGLLFIKIFKAVLILETSFTGTLLTSVSLGVILFPGSFNYYFAEAVTDYFIQRGATAADVATALEEVGLANITAPADNVGAYVLLALMVVAIIVGIIATIVQFKKNEDN